jgi:hypothetical protein
MQSEGRIARTVEGQRDLRSAGVGVPHDPGDAPGGRR